VLVSGPIADRQFVEDLHGELVGFAGSIPAASGTPDGSSDAQAELWGIYLLRAHHGSGLGQQLLDATIGTEPAALWVAEANPRAQAFYRRNGFEFTGAAEPIEDWEGIIEVRMAR
jgi:GNAT superfamily N-acetyltransferase